MEDHGYKIGLSNDFKHGNWLRSKPYGTIQWLAELVWDAGMGS